MSGFDLKKLAEPFPAGDIEWRVSRAGTNSKGVFCMVLAYITARAIQQRLDDVCGPAGWCNTPSSIIEVRPGITAFSEGISIFVDGVWVTKYDVSEPTHVEPAKGGFSGALKRAGAQWGIGRYLYHLSETFAEVAEKGGKGWEYAKLPEKAGGGVYYWKPPMLPSWALPKESESEASVTKKDIDKLYLAWKAKFAAKETNRQSLAASFQTFVESVFGEFKPISDPSCWTQNMIDDCQRRINATKDVHGPDASVPFDE